MTNRRQERGFAVLNEIKDGAWIKTIVTDPEKLAQADMAETIGEAYANGAITLEQAIAALNALVGDIR